MKKKRSILIEDKKRVQKIAKTFLGSFGRPYLNLVPHTAIFESAFLAWETLGRPAVAEGYIESWSQLFGLISAIIVFQREGERWKMELLSTWPDFMTHEGWLNNSLITFFIAYYH